MPGQNRNAAAEDAGFGEGVEVRRVGRFQLRQAAGLLRQAAEAIAHVHDDLGRVFDVQFAGELMKVHGGGSGFRVRGSVIESLSSRILGRPQEDTGGELFGQSMAQVTVMKC